MQCKAKNWFLIFCRELFIERENATVQEQPLACEANSYFACKKCGQVTKNLLLNRQYDNIYSFSLY